MQMHSKDSLSAFKGTHCLHALNLQVFMWGIQFSFLSKITEDLLSLTTKTAISDKKSEAVKNRDYILHKKEFKRILHELSVRFGNPKTDGTIKTIEDEWLVELNSENLKTMNKLLDSNGFNGKNREISKYWRKLHEIKYPS